MSSILVSPKLKWQILLQRIFDVTNICIYHAATIEKSEKKSSLIQFHISPDNEDYGGLLKCLKEITFYERKKDYYKNNFAPNECSY